MSFDSDRLEQFDLLLENAREYAIFTMDTDARITLWNAGAERILGWTEEEALGQPGEIIFTPEQRATGVPAMEMETAKRHGEASDERWHVRQDGSRFWAKGVMTSLYDDAGRLRGFAKILRDGTREKQHQDDIRELNRRLERHVAARTEQVRALAASLADAEDEHRRRTAAVLHDDVQQRLYGIELALADLVRAAEASAPHDAIAERARSVLGWAAETLGITRRLATDLDPIRDGKEDLPSALAHIARQTERLHGFALTLDASPTLRIEDPATYTFLLQAVRELVFNAVKHAGTEGARLEARSAPPTEGRPGGVAVTVRDHGRGFAPGTEGPTLGLRSVRDRLHLVGGRLDLETAPGEGTRATAWVPAGALPEAEGDYGTAE